MTPLLKSLSDLRNFEYGNFIVFRNSLPFELITRVRRLSSDEPQGILVMMYLVIAEGAGGVNQPPLFNVVEGELEVWKIAQCIRRNVTMECQQYRAEPDIEVRVC